MRYFDTTLLATFVKVVDYGSISAASSTLYLSNSTISEQLDKLENFVGKKLLVRNRNGCALTPVGELLYSDAQNILLSCSHTLEKIRGLDFSGEIRLSITDYFRPNDLSKILRKIQQIFPKLKLHIEILSSSEIANKLLINECDLGILMQIEETHNNEFSIMFSEEPLFWIQSKEFKFSGELPVPVITLSSDCNLKSFICNTLDIHRIPYYIAHTASGVKGLISAVEAGLGISCLNKSSLSHNVKIVSPILKLPTMPFVKFVLTTSAQQELNPTIELIKEMLIQEFQENLII